MAGKVDEAYNFVFFLQLIEQEPGIYVKCYPDYDRQDNILVDLAWERISHDMESES
jgi:hypothetical protein